MRLLLDTHVWLWSHLDPDRLTAQVSSALEDGGNELWLSPISVWELTVLVEKGRIKLTTSVAEWVENALRLAPMNEALITHQIALETTRLGIAHRDPADRLLAATTRVLDLTLVTADHRLIGVEGLSVLPCC